MVVDVNNIASAQRTSVIIRTSVVGLLGGFLAGFNIGGLIVNGISSLDNNYWGKLGIIVGCGLTIAILALCLVNIMIVLATSFIGSQSFMIGIDFIANKGYVEFVKIASTLKSFHLTTVLWAMLGSSLVLTLIGILVQRKACSEPEYHKLEHQRK